MATPDAPQPTGAPAPAPGPTPAVNLPPPAGVPSGSPYAALAAAEADDHKAAQNVLGQAQVQKEQEQYDAQYNAQKGTPGSTLDNLKATAEDVGHRIYDIPRGAIAGVANADAELMSSATNLAAWVTQLPSQVEVAVSHALGGNPQDQQLLSPLAISARQAASAASATGQFLTAHAPKPDTIGGQLTEGVTQFLAPFAVGGEFFDVAKIGSVAARLGANTLLGGATQAAAFNPDDPRLSNLIQKFPALRNPITEFLASKPGDSAAVGRMKNFLEGTGLSAAGEAATEAFTHFLTAARASRALADTVKGVEEAKPTVVDHPSPQPADGVNSDGIEVHEGEMTDEQRRLFEQHTQQANVGGAGERPEATGGSSPVLPGATGGAGKGAVTPIRAFRGAKQPLADAHFGPESLGKNTGNPSSGTGVWFTADKEEASRWGEVTEHNLHFTNPKVYDAGEFPAFDSLADANAFQRKLIDRGYDGIILKNSQVGGNDHYVAFSPDALKAPEARPVAEPEAPKPAPKPAQPKAFDAAAVARQSLQVSPEHAEAVRQAIIDGRYNEVPSLLDDTHRTIPWDTLADGGNLKGLFNAVESHIGAIIKTSHGVGPVSQDAIAQMAKDIGGSVKEVSRLFNDVTGNHGLAARITAGYNIMVASARRLKDLALEAAKYNERSVEGKQALLEFQKHLELHAAILGQVRQSSAEIGRALWAHRQLKASSEAALTDLDELGDTLGDTDVAGALKKFLKKAGSGKLSKVNEAVDQASGGRLMGVIKEFSQGGMLMRFSTQFANLTGNLSKAIIAPLERTIAGTIGSVRGVLMPTAEHASIRAAIAHTAGMVDGIRDSFPLFVKALKEEPTRNLAGRPIRRYIQMNEQGLSGLHLSFAKAINRVGRFVRYPGRAMGAIDNLNMGIGYQGDLSARTYTIAASEADSKGLRGGARTTFINQRIDALKARVPKDVREKSLDAGLYQSFQEAARTKMGYHISKALNSHPLVKLIVSPFVHRPLNMLRQGLSDYTLLGLARPDVLSMIGEWNADSDLALARMAIGTGAVVYGYHLAAGGHITGSRLGYQNTQSLDNIPPYSMRIGDRWYTYNRVDPVGMWLGIAADIHEQMARLDATDPDPQQENDVATLARIATQTVGSVAMDKSFMQSVDQVIEWLGQSNQLTAEEKAQKLMASNLFKFVPFSGGLDTLKRINDPTMRATDLSPGLSSLWESVKAHLPYLSKDLPPQRDLLGRPVQYVGGSTSWWNPFGGEHVAGDQMDQELAKVAVQIRPPPRTLDGIQLTAEQYDDVKKLATQTPLFGGQTLEQFLRALTSSPQWHAMDHSNDNGITYKGDLVKQAIDGAYNYAKNMYVLKNPTFSQAALGRFQAEAAKFTNK